jgi:hypothetical protein
MALFTTETYQMMTEGGSCVFDDEAQLSDKLRDLHRALRSRIQNHDLHIHANTQTSGVVGFESVAGNAQTDTMTISYFRPAAEATLVERLMGRESAESNYNGDARCHPVIELRLTPDHFVVELILSPEAWWDQQNLMGKLAIHRHRNTFYKIIHSMDGDYRLGFWGGTHLSDIHLRTGELSWARALEEWMGTFEEGRDWFRIGYWYDVDDLDLDADQIVAEVFDRIKALYKLYTFLLWTSNNDFLDMHRRQHAHVVYA